MRRPTRRTRSGLTTVELMIGLPILVIMTIVIIQFGTFFLNLQQLTLACRNGALEASQTAGLPSSGQVPSDIVRAIEHQLDSSGIQYCLVRVEHNVGGTPKTLKTTGHPACRCGPTRPLASPPPGRYVRVTVCARLRELMPHSLPLFGVGTRDSARTYSCTVVMRYEL